MKFKHYLSQLLRKTHLLQASDKLRFYVSYAKNYAQIHASIKKYPGFIFPPAYYIYETYHLNYENYYLDGKQTAAEIISLLNKYLSSNEKNFKILDWGCGPARVIRHISDLNPAYIAYGSDYNHDYVQWGIKHIHQVRFMQNKSNPPFDVDENTFHAIYSLSIITHLSEKNHALWVDELYRVLKPGGVLLITSQGDAFIEKLLPDELKKYNRGELVVRSSQIEGNRSYSAFQPKVYMKNLLHRFELLEFIEGGSETNIHGQQDTWLVRK